MKWLLLLIVTITLTGCARPGDHPVSPNCVWSEDDPSFLDLRKISDRRHLRFDAVTAEDMAIRWADQHFGHLPQYDQQSAQCMETLFQGVAKHHGVDVAVVRQYSQARDTVADAMVFLSFGILYVLAAFILTGRIRRQFPPGDSGFWIMTLAMAVGVSLVGVLVGGLSSIVIETFLLNSVHLSYRMNRIPFRQHWPMLFVCCFVVFGLVALILRGFVSKVWFRLGHSQYRLRY
jgi:hypothetical protein